MRRFELQRDTDLTGVSGTGHVADGVLFGDGVCVVRWLGQHRTTTVHPSLASIEAVHLHAGATRLVWIDKGHPHPLDADGNLIAEGAKVEPVKPTAYDPAEGMTVHRVYRGSDDTWRITVHGWPECGYGLGDVAPHEIRIVRNGGTSE